MDVAQPHVVELLCLARCQATWYRPHRAPVTGRFSYAELRGLPPCVIGWPKMLLQKGLEACEMPWQKGPCLRLSVAQPSDEHRLRQKRGMPTNAIEALSLSSTSTCLECGGMQLLTLPRCRFGFLVRPYPGDKQRNGTEIWPPYLRSALGFMIFMHAPASAWPPASACASELRAPQA